ncbi:MAG: hypothetical protein MR598_02485 [Erysipelotrichaceae bacterium]|nr:hypothetical protein [Erysipelotrichaceae bacterium]
MNDRDMYYGSYGYGGFSPLQNMPNGMQPMIGTQIPTQVPNQMMQNTYATSQFNDMNERVNRLERQVKRLDQRLTRLETPYANQTQSQNNEPDNNMYMM